ncbi:hypothetical protein RSAG8_05196, partial [Rhizoctonia solani AG-8 WAC10335]
MFKKPPRKIFTSSALRNSDVKALRQRVLALFPDSKDKVDIDVLVPKGITSCKFDTHLDETGTLYSSAEKDPLWFSMGKGGLAQSNLIPTVYTLWKCPTLLPTISTPAAVIPILAAPGKQPEADITPVAGAVDGVTEALEGVKLDGEAGGDSIGEKAAATERAPTAQEIETTLRATTLYALARLDAASLPLPASTLYSSHILPSRPARPTVPSSNATEQPIDPKTFLSHLDIKHTPHKKLAPFLKTFEKDGILKLKDVRGELLVFSVDAKHPALADVGKWGWKTIGAEEREKKEREKYNAADESVKEILVEEVWFPEASTESFFEACGESTAYYTLLSLRRLLNKYITTHNLQHPTNPKFVVLDEVLSRALLRKGEDGKEFLGRDELVERLSGNMKGMWRVGGTGGFKKMPLHPINVRTKKRQGRKVVTLITGFESFGLDPEVMSDELRKRCASSTSVAPCVEKPKQLEVMVQGGQTKAVTALLLELGVPKKWVQVSENTGKGKGGK